MAGAIRFRVSRWQELDIASVSDMASLAQVSNRTAGHSVTIAIVWLCRWGNDYQQVHVEENAISPTVLELARVERHVVRARVERALSPQDRPTECSLDEHR